MGGLREFGLAAWGGFIKRRQLYVIDRIQKRAIEILESVKDMPYEEQSRKFKLPAITYWRARGMKMEVWKHINSYGTAVILQTFQFTRAARYPFSSNVSTIRSVSLSHSIIWHLHYGTISLWQLERQSVGIHLIIDWTCIGEGIL